MAEFLLKAARDKDLYLIWSTNVDGYLTVGTRRELTPLLVDQEQAFLCPDPYDHKACRVCSEMPKISEATAKQRVSLRFERADKTGTSCLIGDYGGWGSPGLVVYGHPRPMPPEGGPPWWLARGKLYEYAVALYAGPHEDSRAAGLLEPMPDE